jgi:Na+/H+ antiporter NhaD/arsenite permease-like protein
MDLFYLGMLIFVATFIGIATEKLPRSIVALAGCCLMIVFKIVDQEAAFRAIDLNVIFLLAGMMIIIHILAKSGIFQWIAIKTFRVSRGNPITIMILLSLSTAFVSSFLDNVTTVLLIAPVTIVLVQYLELDPVPFLIMEVIASNIGGTATLIGDPPNILIGSSAGLGFNTFLVHLTPVILIVTAAFVLTIKIVFRKSFHVSNELKARIMEVDPNKAITDASILKKSLFVLALVIIGFVSHEPFGFEAATIALTGATLLIILTKSDPDEAFKSVEWTTLFFYIGLFVVVQGLVEIGAIKMMSHKLFALTHGNKTAMTLLVLWFSGITCSCLNNIPFVATMIPIIKDLGAEMPAYSGAALLPLWWALALGSCLGGNGTIIGSSANFIVAGIANKSGYKISFWRFFKYGAPLTLQSLVICSVYVYIRYCLK